MASKIDYNTARAFLWRWLKDSNRTVYGTVIGSNLVAQPKHVRVALFLSVRGEIINISHYAAAVTGIPLAKSACTPHLLTPPGNDAISYAVSELRNKLNEGVFLKEKISARRIMS